MRVSRFWRKMGPDCRSAALSLLIWTSLLPSPRAESAELAPISAALQSLLANSGSLRIAERSLATKPLQAFYRERNYAPVWLAGEAGSRRTDLLLQVLDNAADHGLDPAEYRSPASAVSEPPSDVGQAVRYELLLTDAYRRYAADVRTGRIQPAEAGHRWAIDRPPFDPLRELARALQTERLAELLAGLPPPHTGYAELLEALRRYRGFAAQGGWPPFPAGPSLKPGQSDPRVPLLRRRLSVEGEFISSATADQSYEAEIEQAVRRFQHRHGLAVDGIVGPATTAALNVGAEERVRQILVNLTRWRWLPRDLGDRHLIVNTAAATLRVVEDGKTAFTSKVIVGTRSHPTPIVEGRIDSVVFNPPWNVPRSIAVNEILPRLRRDPRYLAKENLVIVGRRSDPFGLGINWWQVSARQFDFRLRQPPGAGNALGRIKFDFRNPFSVYLHDTPTKSLFERSNRFFSHGCVRVEKPRALAAYLLADRGWDRNAVGDAITVGVTRRVTVTSPLPVYLLYWTAFVEDDGTMHFREDVYGRDRRIFRSLQDRTVHPAPEPDHDTCGG